MKTIIQADLYNAADELLDDEVLVVSVSFFYARMDDAA